MRKKLLFIITTLISIVLITGSIYAEDKMRVSDILEDNSQLSIGVVYNHLWRGVAITEGVNVYTSISAEIMQGIGFAVDSYFNVTKLEMSWAEYKLRYIHMFTKTLSLQGGLIHYDIDGAIKITPDTTEFYAKIEDLGITNFSGAIFYDFNKGGGAFIELASKYYYHLNDNMSIGPGGLLSINIGNKLLESFNSFVSLHVVQAYGFYELSMNKKMYINLLGGISLPLYINAGSTTVASGTQVVNTTKTIPFAKASYTYLF